MQHLHGGSRLNNTTITSVVLQFRTIRFVYNLFGKYWIITPHAQRERGKVIGRGVHIYIYNIYIYVCGRKKNLNRTLEIDSPFQTLTVGLLVEFID